MYNVLILVRFSYLGAQTTYWKRTGLPLPERAALLFRPDRMQARFKLFEQICLPSLAGQGHGTASIVLASEAMPEHHKARLRDLVAPYGNIHLYFEAPAESDAAFTNVIVRENLANDVVITARVDDDDAVAVDFGTHMHRYASPRWVGAVISPTFGVKAARNAWGQTVFYPYLYRCGPVGLALVADRREPRTVFSTGNHTKVDTRHPTLFDASALLFFKTAHGFNESVELVPPRIRWLPTAVSPAVPPQRFAAEFPFIQAADWPTIMSGRETARRHGDSRHTVRRRTTNGTPPPVAPFPPAATTGVGAP